MTVLEGWRGVPPRFWLLASCCSVVLLVWGLATPWSPWRENGTVLSNGWGSAVNGFSIAVWVLAPILALRWPVAAALAATPPLLATLSDAGHYLPFTYFLCLLAIGLVTTWQRPLTGAGIAIVGVLTISTWAAGLTTVLMPYGAELSETSSWTGWLAMCLAYGAPSAAALGFANWMRASYRSKARELELQRRTHAVADRSALVAERARLAHDLHDVVAHHLSLIAVRAETAPYTNPTLDGSARTVLAEVATDARLALDELRAVLGILGRAEQELELAPQPGLGDVADLISRARTAGQPVELSGEPLPSVSSAVGYTAYRIVQEALTNARKHAPGQLVRISIKADTTSLVLAIRNPPTRPPADIAPDAHTGHGLIGMRERVAALGGELLAGSSSGDYEVVARLPMRVSRP